MSIYIGPIIKCTNPMMELDGGGKPWGFSECCELLSDDVGDIKALHDIAKKSMSYFDWFILTPVPHHRISRQSRQKAIDAGAVPVTQEELEGIAANMIQKCLTK